MYSGLTQAAGSGTPWWFWLLLLGAPPIVGVVAYLIGKRRR